jgi:hypothetical protein
MSSSLTDGLVVVVSRIVHCGRRTSLPYIIGLHKKNMVYGRKENRREELHHRIFDAERCMNDPDVLRKVQIILNFKYPSLYNS